jgi:hypothetical protein
VHTLLHMHLNLATANGQQLSLRLKRSWRQCSRRSSRRDNALADWTGVSASNAAAAVCTGRHG